MHKKVKIYLVLALGLLATAAVTKTIALTTQIELMGVDNTRQIIVQIGGSLLGGITTLVTVALQLVALQGLLDLRAEGQGPQSAGLNWVTVLGMVATAFRAAFVLVSVILVVVAIAKVKMEPRLMPGTAFAISQQAVGVVNTAFGVFIMALLTQIVHEISVLKRFRSHTQMQYPL